MYNQNQVNDVTKICLDKILLIISLYSYFHAIIEGVLGTKENALKMFIWLQYKILIQLLQNRHTSTYGHILVETSRTIIGSR